MATLTIRNLDESVKRALQVRAALNGRSMEAEARDVLYGVCEVKSAVRTSSGHSSSQLPGNSLPTADMKEGLGTAIQKLFAPLGGVELKIPTSRKSHRKPPDFPA